MLSKLKPITKSLIIGILIIIINFATYVSFRYFVTQDAPFLEGLIFTTYESIIHFLIVVPVSFVLFKLVGKK